MHEEIRTVHKIFVGKLDWMKPYGRARLRCKNNIKMDFIQISC